jgi:hypothetical protein
MAKTIDVSRLVTKEISSILKADMIIHQPHFLTQKNL